MAVEDNISVDFTLEDNNHIDVIFEINATGTTWGNILGNLEDQTDLKNVLDSLDAQITNNHNDITSLTNTIQTYGDIVTYDAANFATSAQGALANTALQPGDNITELVNNAGYITAASLPTVNNSTITIQKNGVNVESFTLNQEQSEFINLIIPTDTNDLINGAGYITAADLPIVNNGKLTIQVNSTDVATFTANQSTDVTANITVPDSATWGNITGTLSDQTDLQTALNAKYDASNPAGYITSSALNGYATESFVTSQGYITSADLPTLEDLTTTTQLNAINSGATTALINQITTNKNAITSETTNRQNADNNLQSQIDAITAASDVTDIVGTYAQLQAYDTSSLPPNSIIKVLQDENRNNETTYYRWVITGGVGSWVLIGEEGPYYTIAAANSTFVPQTRTINGYALSNNINLTASDVGALTSADLVNYVTTNTAQDISGRKTFLGEKAIYFKQQAATNKLGFTLYNVSNAELGALEYRPNTINGGALLNVNVPYSSSDYVGFRYWGTAVNVVAPKVSTAGNYYIPVNITDGSNTVTANSAGTVDISSLTNITSSDVTDALGYTPYNSTNPNGYTSNVGTVTSVNNEQPDSAGNVAIIPNPAYGTSSTAAATVEKAVSIPEITELNVGQIIVVQPSETSSVANSTIKLNNFTAYPMRYNGAAITTSTDSIVWSSVFPSQFIFDGTYWVFLSHGVDSNTTYSLNYSQDSGLYKLGTGSYVVTRYSLMMQTADMTWEKITDPDAKYSTATTKTVNTHGFRLGQLKYYSSTSNFATGATMATNVVYDKAASVDMRYSTNCGATPGWTDGDYIYLVGTMGNDGLFYLDTTQWWTNTLPSTNDGKLYMRVGLYVTTYAYSCSLLTKHPVFYHDGNRICEYVNADNLSGGGAVIDDNTPSTTTVYSSQKTQDLIDALVARIAALEANINGGNA